MFNDVTADGDINVNHIVIVGRFLDFAGLGDTLPFPLDLPQYDNEIEAIKTLLVNPYGFDMTKAISQCGEILKTSLNESKIQYSGKVFQFRKLVSTIAIPLFAQLQKFGYWDVYSEGN